VAQVAQHAAGDQLAYAMKLTGAAGPDFGPFAPSGDFEPDRVERAVTASAAGRHDGKPAGAVVKQAPA